MPRVSQAVAKQTRQNIIDASIKIIVLEGRDKMTFSHIAKKANISRSGINCHFKRKEDLLREIKSSLFERVHQALDFSSANAFYQSWKSAVDEDRMFRNIITNLDDVFNGKDGVESLAELIQGNEKDIQNAIYMAIGYAVINV